MTTSALGTAWQHGRFDAVRGPGRILFGRMYEDTAIEDAAFKNKPRVFCIASAGCTALALAHEHDVVAVDINPVQLAYAQQRIAGGSSVQGVAERIMGFARRAAPVAGWRRARVRAFVEAGDVEEQLADWHHNLNTRRFRWGFDALLSVTLLRRVYASPFLQCLPPRLGGIMRRRMERCFAVFPNAHNPYARLLLLGEEAFEPTLPVAHPIELVHADAAGYLENVAPRSFDGFTLSNILDGADDSYRTRLFAAVRRAAAPGAMVVLRSFEEPSPKMLTNRAADDRSMLWGVVDVRPAADLGTAP
jgi:S-adenosylmethionine:diacylglycerol 3-amino-3-carboxypropyl transferase